MTGPHYAVLGASGLMSAASRSGTKEAYTNVSVTAITELNRHVDNVPMHRERERESAAHPPTRIYAAHTLLRSDISTARFDGACVHATQNLLVTRINNHKAFLIDFLFLNSSLIILNCIRATDQAVCQLRE